MRSSDDMLDEINLVEITPSSVYHNFPKFFQEHTQFYFLEYETDENKEEVAIYGITSIDHNICEISLYVFCEFRFKLPYRQVLKLILQQPFELGFNKILIWTYEKSVATLLRQCKGIRELETFDDCVWFMKERG